jgi:uncharacterized protein
VTAPAAAPTIPRFLERSVAFELTRNDSGDDSGDGRSFEGYAAVFNSETTIDSWEGRFFEKIAPGSFKKSVRERTPVLQFDHGRHPMVGSIPIGAIRKVAEDSKGLLVAARLSENWLIEPVREAIANKSINGMSFRFEVVKQEWHYKGKRVTDPDELMRLLYGRRDEGDEDEPLVRTLREVKVPELGPVVFPAYPDTTASVRSKELADAIAQDPEMVRRVRAGLAGTMEIKPREEMRDAAYFILFGERSDAPQETPPATVETGEQTDSMHTEVTPEPDQPEPTEEAPAQDEPLVVEEHSDDAVEPPAAGHSEPESETPEGGRSQTPTAVIAATNLDEAERQLARMRMAEKLKQRSAQATSKMERYSR